MSTLDIPGRRIAWFNCAAGVAGDMTLAALVDAGADPDAIAHAISGLGIDGYALGFESVQRCGIRARWTNLVIHDGQVHTGAHDHTAAHGHTAAHDHESLHRPASEVLALLEAADLAPRVRDRALRVYRTLAEIEGEIHGIDWEAVELHEVGALDSIIDVVGACAALESLGVDEIVCSPIALGHGTVATLHGRLPNPVPAVIALLAAAGAPAVGIDTTMETATPTGVALMTTLASGFGAMPAMSVIANGFGAGTADPPGRPNVVQVVVGIGSSSTTPRPGREALLIEANVDDVTGEVISHTIAALLAAGAHDAWATPIVMKKGRPAHGIHALCDDAHFDAVAAVLLRETGTLGMRASRWDRWPQQREEFIVHLHGQPIGVKVAAGRVKVEYDDALRAAGALGLALREVLAQAEALAAPHAVPLDTPRAAPLAAPGAVDDPESGRSEGP